MRTRAPAPDVLDRFRAIAHRRRQAAEVRRLWPMLTVNVGGTTLVVSGEVQPRPLSETYRVRVVYTYGSVPEAYVDEPALRPRDDGSPIPHVYAGPRPCLYLPGSGEWTGEEMIATTIIPWLLLWLEFYELWHATGVWKGGGVHPDHPAGEAAQPDTDSSAPEQAPDHAPTRPA